MNVKAGIYSLLTADAGVAALVGTRVYPITLPEPPTLPAVRYAYAGGTSEATFETSGMQRVRLQVDCFGEKALDAETLRTAVIAALNGFVGLLSDGTYLLNAELITSLGSDYFENDPRQYRSMAEFYLFFDLP